MRIEMLPGEVELLREMCGGTIPQATTKLFYLVREKLLLGGHSFQMQKEILAVIVALSGAVTAAEPVERETPVHETNGHSDPTPDDELSASDLAALEAEAAALNPEATGGEYKGRRIHWQSDFKSTPKTPIAKLEKGRPISIIEDGQRLFGKFVKVHPKRKGYCTILTSKMKKPYPVEMHRIEVTDLSRPSPIPLAVQI